MLSTMYKFNINKYVMPYRDNSILIIEKHPTSALGFILWCNSIIHVDLQNETKCICVYATIIEIACKTRRQKKKRFESDNITLATTLNW